VVVDTTAVRSLKNTNWMITMAAPKPMAINASRQWICAAGVCESLSSHGKAIGVCPTGQARLEVIHEWEAGSHGGSDHAHGITPLVVRIF
jgi:hypothetical protein